MSQMHPSTSLMGMSNLVQLICNFLLLSRTWFLSNNVIVGATVVANSGPLFRESVDRRHHYVCETFILNYNFVCQSFRDYIQNHSAFIFYFSHLPLNLRCWYNSTLFSGREWNLSVPASAWFSWCPVRASVLYIFWHFIAVRFVVLATTSNDPFPCCMDKY